MKAIVLSTGFGLLAASCLATMGCGGSGQAGADGVMPAGAVFVLADEPADAQGVVACRAALEQSQETTEVVLEGRIGGLSQPTWEPDRAAFMIADLELAPHEDLADEAPQHDADNCPFCRAKQKKEMASTALVQLVDAQGEIPTVSAQELLGLEEGQTVVIQGTAALDNLDILTVRARGVFVRPK